MSQERGPYDLGPYEISTPHGRKTFFESTRSNLADGDLGESLRRTQEAFEAERYFNWPSLQPIPVPDDRYAPCSHRESCELMGLEVVESATMGELMGLQIVERWEMPSGTLLKLVPRNSRP